MKTLLAIVAACVAGGGLFWVYRSRSAVTTATPAGVQPAKLVDSGQGGKLTALLTPKAPAAPALAPLVSALPVPPQGYYWQDNSKTYAPITSPSDPIVKDLQPGQAPRLTLTQPGDTISALGLIASDNTNPLNGSTYTGDGFTTGAGVYGPGWGLPILLQDGAIYYTNIKNGHVVLNNDGAPQLMSSVGEQQDAQVSDAQETIDQQTALEQANFNTEISIFTYGEKIISALA